MNKQGFSDEDAAKVGPSRPPPYPPPFQYCEMAKDRTKIPAGRAAQPREIGEVIMFLADSKKSDYIIGQCLVVDGGRSMTRPPL